MVLTRLGVIVLALIALLGIVEQWSGGEGFPLWRLCAIGCFAAFLYERLQLRGPVIRAQSDDEPQLRLGRQETLSVDLRNDHGRPLDVEFVSGLPAGVDRQTAPRRMTLPPAQSLSVDFALRAVEMGSIAWPNLPARVRGFLGLAKWHTRIPIDRVLKVVPDTAGARGSARGHSRAGALARRIGQGMELHYQRDYVDGDPLHAIDWKATARSQRLISRVFSDEQHLEIVLLIDVGRTASTRVDGVSQYSHYCNLLARFAEAAVATGDHVGLVVAAARPLLVVPPVAGPRAIRSIRNALADNSPRAEETDLVAAALALQQSVRKRALVVLFSDLYGQSSGDSLARCVRLLRMRHRLIAVGLLGDDILSLASGPARDKEAVYQALAAQEFQSALRRNADGIRNLGASAILSRPAGLHEAVFNEYRRLRQQRRV